jgi:N-acetylglucosamine-6-phosphate deacetylase
MHCHGVSRFDFTEIPELELQTIDDVLAERGHNCVLTLYLPRKYFEGFLNLTEIFHRLKEQGKLTHIEGFALEGPLLDSYGGTPGSSIWMPDKQQWNDLAHCGKNGLIYVIMSPDAAQTNGLSVRQISEILLDGNVLPAPGHFTKTNPMASARALQSIFDAVEESGHVTVTDHLFNDMPLNFKHAWRTPGEKAKRKADLEIVNPSSWNINSIEQDLGPVPATMIRNARKGITKLCQNFDGEHVDLEIVQHAVRLVGAENMMMMTDTVESKRLGGQDLVMKDGSNLLYQDKGIVAAGTTNVEQQIKNMFSIGLNTVEVEAITNVIPRSVLTKRIKRSSHATACRV